MNIEQAKQLSLTNILSSVGCKPSRQRANGYSICPLSVMRRFHRFLSILKPTPGTTLACLPVAISLTLFVTMHISRM